MSFNDWDQPVDLARVRSVMERVNRTHPLKGIRTERVSKSIYTSPQTTSLKAARLAAEALIERRKGEGR